MIFPLSFTLTAFLMWIIVSLNGTILHLSQRKQRSKLAMFKRLWRILVISVIAIFAFFVISTMSLSGRLEEDYAARNWKYRWVLLDASLAVIYLAAFGAIAWLWRPVSVKFLSNTETFPDEMTARDEDRLSPQEEADVGTDPRQCPLCNVAGTRSRRRRGGRGRLRD